MSVLSNFFDQPMDVDGRITPVYFGLVIILSIMLGGALPSVLYVFSRNALWVIWALSLLLIVILGVQLSLPRLLLPALPLVAWLTVYVCWGTLAAPYPVFASACRLWFRFVCIIFSIAIVTSHPRRLAFFANATQWVLVANLFVTWWLMTYPDYQQHPFFMRMTTTIGSDRFAGLWGDANLAGLAALFILVLSYWANRWIAWVGRISCVMIIYLTASRTAFWIAVMLGLFYFVFAASKKSRFRVVMIAMALVLGGAGYMNTSKDGGLAYLKENPTFSRVFDLSESRTRERGEESRVDLAKKWLSVAAREPWFGYGLYSSAGDNAEEAIGKRGFPTQGTHNLYLALYIDAGWVVLALFLFVILRQIYKLMQIPLSLPILQTLLALCFTMLVFSLASHQMVTDYIGWMGFSFIFLLPMSPALRDPLPE